MDNTTVGIDVSKDRLDVAMRPGGELFVVARNAAGLEELVESLYSLAPAWSPWKPPAASRRWRQPRWLRLACRS